MTQFTSTIPACTVREINADIATLSGMIDGVDSFLGKLRSEPARFEDWVVGLPQYGRFLNRKRQLTSVLGGALYPTKSAAFNAGVGITNGAGERMTAMPLRDALDAVIDMQDALRLTLCGQLTKLYEQRVEAGAYERHLDDCAERERVLAEYRLDQRL